MSFMDLPIANQLIDVAGLVVLLIIILGVIYKLKQGTLHRFSQWKIFSRGTAKKGSSSSSSSSNVAPSFFTVFYREVFTFKVLGTCSRTKRLSHIAIFWGFVFLGISTVLAFLLNPTDVILPLYNPVKIFGNTGGILVIIGFIGMFYVRYREKAPIWRFTRSDLFLTTLLLAVITGFITQQTIYSSMGSYWVSSSFWIHMVFVVSLLATAPFTKFYHAISKPVSLLYQEIDRRSSSDVEPLLPTPNTMNDSTEVKK